ncbi:MAG: hypothetical protein QM762_06095 [Chryseolinea sp.]
MEKRPYNNILHKYLNGECTPQEKAEVEEWFASIDTMNDDSRLMDADAEAGLRRKMLDEIRQRIALEHRGQTGNMRRWWSPMRVAATLLVVALAGITFVFLKRDTTLSFVYNGEATAQVVTLQNYTSKVETHRLPDGSTIKLSPREPSFTPGNLQMINAKSASSERHSLMLRKISRVHLSSTPAM